MCLIQINVLSLSLPLFLSLSLNNCYCGKMADARDTRGLLCHLAFGMLACYHEVNDLVWWVLCEVNLPSMREPSDPVWVGSEHPDGSRLISWYTGNAMAWDVTVVNKLEESYITLSASPGGAAEHHMTNNRCHICY